MRTGRATGLVVIAFAFAMFIYGYFLFEPEKYGGAPRGQTQVTDIELLDAPQEVMSLVEAKGSAQYTPYDKNAKLSSAAYWFRFKVKNNSRFPQRLLFDFQADKVWLFPENTGLNRTSISGRKTPFSVRGEKILNEQPIPGWVRNWVGVVIAASSEERFYLYVKNSDATDPIKGFTFAFSDAAWIAYLERQARLFLGGALGALASMMAFAAMMFFATRFAAYVWYVAHLACVALYWAAAFGIGFEYFWTNDSGITYYVTIGSLCSMAATLVLFARSFLGTKIAVPRVDRMLLAIATLVVVAGGLHLVVQPIAEILLGVVLALVFASYAMVIYAGLASLEHSRQAATHALWATTCSALGFCFYYLGEQGILWFSWISGFSGLIGSILEALIYSLGLAIGYREIQKKLTDELVQKERAIAVSEREKRALFEHQAAFLEEKVAERTKELSASEGRAKDLLHNILPVDIAEELGRTGETRPARHENSTILFSDFGGFTNIVATIPAEKLVSELNVIFQEFDEIIDRNGIEKIKTIGDAYMAAGGLPREQKDHAVRCIRAALEMTAFIEERNRTSAIKWQLRVGVHSGFVIAGVVGKRKYVYDVWGDTVNTAARLESTSEPGRVNVSAYTYDLIKESFSCEYRGKIEAKGKGELDMYFVVSAK